MTGRRKWHVVGCYIALSNALTIEYVTADIKDQPYGAELLVARNFNINLAYPEGTPQGEAIADELAVTGLMDMGIHFLPQCKTWLQDR